MDFGRDSNDAFYLYFVFLELNLDFVISIIPFAGLKYSCLLGLVVHSSRLSVSFVSWALYGIVCLHFFKLVPVWEDVVNIF